jgi:hypothetical protein
VRESSELRRASARTRAHPRVSPRTVRKYLPKPRSGYPRGDQRWTTFLANHAQAILACDFFVTVTCSFRLLCVFVVMEHHSRRLIHRNVTAHPVGHADLRMTRRAYAHLLDATVAKTVKKKLPSLGLERSNVRKLRP